MLLAPAIAAICAALMLFAAAPLRAEPATGARQSEFERMLKDYLAAHPEAIQEALDTLAARKAAAKAEQQKATIKANQGELFSSPRQVTLGDRAGDVTLVEFFDYNCGYCKRALADLLELMNSDPKLKVVLKEYPILGPDSVEAARVAVAVRMQDAGARYLAFHRKLLENRGHNDKARALAAAEEAGFDMTRLERDMASEEVTQSLDESIRLGKELAINGTPGYVVGERVVIGARGEQVLRESVAAARK
ncbi:MAG: DsbA family protein [Hyphomicrobiales bacterium]|nr:DsbA family protein [Hyphomicrobiales bacterium]MBV8823439.1 DsbA family protein [Hyphomicrobiales bacterium]MBV9429583.1 DsbA family protein [Bradyrhizobiaceae bacterium]